MSTNETGREYTPQHGRESKDTFQTISGVCHS